MGRGLAKIVTGWAAHLFYWVYPGVMVAFMATLIGYIYGQLSGNTISNAGLSIIAILFALLTGFIAMRGVTGSTLTSIVINVVQLTTLVIFSCLAIYYRWTDAVGPTQWHFNGGWDVLLPHSFTGVMIQSTIAILILVGFESCTAFAAETKNPKKNIPRAVILSLVIQGLLAYLFEYFAAGYMVSDKLVAKTASGETVTGMAAAAASSAPIGDMAILVGNNVLHGIGFGLMVSIAVTVALAILGTTLSCLNTAVRVSYAMARDEEMPEILGVMHGKFATPHKAIWVLVVVSIGIAIIGVQSVVGLTGITLASNLGNICPLRADLRLDDRCLPRAQRTPHPETRAGSCFGVAREYCHAGFDFCTSTLSEMPTLKTKRSFASSSRVRGPLSAPSMC